MSHFSSIFQTDDIGLGQAVLQEVRDRQTNNSFDRILSELEETVEISLGNRITSNNTGCDNLITDTTSENSENDRGSDKMTTREKALKRLIQQLEEHQKFENISQGSSGFQTESKSRMTSVTEIDVEDRMNSGQKLSGKKVIDVHDSGCSCHDTAN